MSVFDKQALKLLQANTREKAGHVYTVPSPENYPFQWLWDSCFHATVLSHFDTKRAKGELWSLISKQFKNGLLPHMIYWDKAKPFGTLLTDIKWGHDGTSTITQPPIIAETVLRIYQKDADLEFVTSIYPNLKLFYQYLLLERDSRGNHLIGIINPDESGEDNSSRFDIPLKLPVIQSAQQNLNQRLSLVEKNKICKFNAPLCMKNFFWVKDLPFNCYMVKNLNSMSTLAKILKLDQDSAVFKGQAKLIAEAMKKYMSEDSLYWSVYDPDLLDDKIVSYKKIKVLTWAIFAPLYANLLTQKEAENLIDDHLLNKKEFWLSYPVPTVSFSDPSFDPEGFWRGPTWMNTNWFIFQGLLTYGFEDLARELYKISKFMVEGQVFREQYNPLTGAGQGAKNFTWGTLVVDMEQSLKAQ